MTTICFSANTAWNLLHYRGGLIRELIARGDRVITATPAGESAAKLATLGCEVVELPMARFSTSITHDGVLFCRLLRILQRFRPAVFLTYTIKPVIYGGLASRILRIPYVTTITGLGAAFSDNSPLTRLVHQMYRISQKSARAVIFQNSDDQSFFLEHGLASLHNSKVVMGSGVDLSKFRFVPLRRSGDSPSFLMMSRLVWDKGVREFVEAAAIVKKSFPNARFQLMGPTDEVSESEVRAWEEAGMIEYLGVSQDVRGHIEQADCIVLPSYYREGVPRSLMEAAAMGRPVITTDSIGCRNVVTDELNGFLCRPRDANDLALKMQRFIKTGHEERMAMSVAGREKAEREFDERLVIDTYIGIIDAHKGAGKRLCEAGCRAR